MHPSLCTFSGDGLDTELVETSDAKNPTYGGVLERVRFHTPVDGSSLLPR